LHNTQKIKYRKQSNPKEHESDSEQGLGNGTQPRTRRITLELGLANCHLGN